MFLFNSIFGIFKVFCYFGILFSCALIFIHCIMKINSSLFSKIIITLTISLLVIFEFVF